MNGWMGQVLRIDLSSVSWRPEDLDLDIAGQFLDGRGLGTYLMWSETAADLDPLSPENKLIFATGRLTGTKAPTAGRFSLSTKSPLTGTISIPIRAASGE
jgi:aldehyde:ferredoxin oxidoreductase